MTVPLAPDDVVATHAEARANARPPLLVLEPLAAFLDGFGLGSGPIAAEPVGEGHSNVTFRIRRGDLDAIVRRPPRPPLPPSAHDMLREARVLRALGPTPVPVPRVLAVCEDPDVIGAPFYVMERVEGAVVTDTIPAALDTPDERRRMAEALVDALVELHAVDWQAAGLDGFGKPSGYLERQLRRFTGLWEHNRTREIPEVEHVAAWLAEHRPDSPAATIVHGDFRLGNSILAARAPTGVLALLDWEMATIGDPLADVGYLCMGWAQAGDPPGGMFELARVTRAEGFPTREELVARYEARSGRSMTDIRWYTTLAVWKALVFMEGNYKRAVAGSTDDPYLRSFGDGVLELAARAQDMTR